MNIHFFFQCHIYLFHIDSESQTENILNAVFSITCAKVQDDPVLQTKKNKTIQNRNHWLGVSKNSGFNFI